MIERLTRRADFLKAARARRVAMPGLVMQMRPRPDAPDAPFRIGFTVTKKVGNAVVRNRAKRRLRAAADATLPRYGLPARDYVVIGRVGTLTRPFALLLADFERALAKLHGGAAPPTYTSPSQKLPSLPSAPHMHETHTADDRRKS